MQKLNPRNYRKLQRKLSKIGGFKMTRHEYRNEYLKSEEWKKLRDSFMRNHDGNCEKCGSIGSDVHHMEYKFLRTNSEQKSRLIFLCRGCHNLVHSAIKCKILQFPHYKDQILKITEDAVKKQNSKSRKKHLVSMMLISEIVNNGSWHGIKMACGVLKITTNTFCSIPPNLKATMEQINHLEWIAKTKPTAKISEYEKSTKPNKISKREKERIKQVKIELGLRQPKSLNPF